MNPNHRFLDRIFSGVVVFSLLLSLTGCSSADNVAKGFIRAIASGDAGKALDYVCVEDGVSLIFAIGMDWSDDYYKVLNQTSQETQVLVSGKAKITMDNLQNFAMASPDLQQYIIDNHIDLPRIGVGLQVAVNFDGLYIKYDEPRKKWCVEGRSITGLRDYLVNLFINVLTPK